MEPKAPGSRAGTPRHSASRREALRHSPCLLPGVGFSVLNPKSLNPKTLNPKPQTVEPYALNPKTPLGLCKPY